MSQCVSIGGATDANNLQTGLYVIGITDDGAKRDVG